MKECYTHVLIYCDFPSIFTRLSPCFSVIGTRLYSLNKKHFLYGLAQTVSEPEDQMITL